MVVQHQEALTRRGHRLVRYDAHQVKLYLIVIKCSRSESRMFAVHCPPYPIVLHSDQLAEIDIPKVDLRGRHRHALAHDSPSHDGRVGALLRL